MSEVAYRTTGHEPRLMEDLVRRPRLLVVDEDPVRAQALLATLGDDYDAAIAGSVEQALQACDARSPDLLVIDGRLASLCRGLRAREATAETPVLLITDSGEPQAQSAALDAGATDLVERPIQPRLLRSRVWAQVTLKRQADLLRQWVYIDGLTGVCNRSYFDDRLAAEWGRAVRQGTLLGLLRIDIDEFAAYNGHYGHAQGDECLRRVAGLLRGSLKRPGDLVARMAGAEFACLLPDTDLEGGLDLAHRLRLSLRGLGIEHVASAVAPHLTLSMGLATKPVDVVGSVALLLRESAAQLQVAKSRGRDQCCGAELEDF